MRKFTKPTWLAIGWLSLMMFFAIFGWVLPFKSWNFVYEDDLEVGFSQMAIFWGPTATAMTCLLR